LVSRARLAAQNKPALRFPSGWLATHWAGGSGRGLEPGAVGGGAAGVGFELPGDCGRVQGATSAGSGDEFVA
jgi:hypothetical protein